MHARSRSRRQFRPSLAFILLIALLVVLWGAGGATRADVFGQVVVRVTAWLLLVIGIMAGSRPDIAAVRPVPLLLLLAILLAALQLLPLPPPLWQALPGRSMFIEAAAMTGQPQPWRSWSIVPGATINALSSLVVPLATLLFAAALRADERGLILPILLGMVIVSTLVGLLQFSGAGIENPFANETAGEVSGMFANRNHFALFTAVGCILAPVWAFNDRRRAGWRGLVAFGLVSVFALTILASGSRAGILLGVVALAMGLLLVQRGIRRELERAPRWAFPALIMGGVTIVAILVFLSIASDRAISIDRALASDPGQDMRGRGLPVVLAMIARYFPMGSGLGAFDPIFRINEPFGLLKVTYFNHAHNDFLEIILDGGLPGLVLLAGAVSWWVLASIRAWRSADLLPRLGSAIILLVLIASAFDYPARAPIIMATIILAGTWLCPRVADRAALPKNDLHL